MIKKPEKSFLFHIFDPFKVKLKIYQYSDSYSNILYINKCSFPLPRIEVAGILKQMRIENIKHKYEAEEQAAHQHYKVGYHSH